MSDLSVVVISLSIIVLCWAVVRLNQKLNESLSKPMQGNTIDRLGDRSSENFEQASEDIDSEPAFKA